MLQGVREKGRKAGKRVGARLAFIGGGQDKRLSLQGLPAKQAGQNRGGQFVHWAEADGKDGCS